MSRLRNGALVLPPLVLAGLSAAYVRSAQIDDAYISYRYAANLTAGHGLVFNPGQRVEGFSNLAWTLLLALAHACGAALPDAGAVLGWAAVLATVALTYTVTLRLTESAWVAVTVAAAVAITTDFVASATMGLEGGLVAALLLVVLWRWDRVDGSRIALVIALVVLAGTRPELLVLAAVLALLRRDLLVTVPVLVGLALIEIGRVAYYGEAIPMSVTAKRDIGGSVWSLLTGHLHAGVKYVVVQLSPADFILLFAVGFGAVVLVGRQDRPEAPLETIPGVVMLLAGFGLPLLSGGDWMPNMRLIAPYLPVLYILVAVIGLRSGFQWAAPALVGVMAASLALTATFPMRGGHNLLASDSQFDTLGRAVAKAHLGTRVVATFVLGRMAFYAPDVHVSDVFGLTEPKIAETHEPGTVYGKTNYAYTMSLRPAVIAGNDWVSFGPMLAASQNGIRYVAVSSPGLLPGRVFVLADPNVAPSVAAALTAEGDPATVIPLADGLRTWGQVFPRGQ